MNNNVTNPERPTGRAVDEPRRYPICPDRLPEGRIAEGRYEVRFARTREELDRTLALRYEVFNLELGEGLEASHETGRDEDEFDAFCHHLLVVDLDDDDRLVGSYRLQTAGMAAEHLGFYSGTIFDLSAVPEAVIRNSLELGRACVARSHRSTQVLFLLWRGLALYVAANRKRYLFGCSSLTSQDPAEGWALAAQLETRGHLHPDIRVHPLDGYLLPDEGESRQEAPPVKVPPLFRTYLRHGARICGPPAIDRQFKTIDWLVIFDVDTMPRRMFRTFFA